MKQEQRGVIPVIVIIVLALLALGSGIVYYFGPAKQLKVGTKTGIKTEDGKTVLPQTQVTEVPRQKGRSSRSEALAPTTATDEFANWQEYKNERFPYKVKYPPDWYFLKRGYNPPPPVGVMFSNLQEGYQMGVNFASIDISVLPAEGESLEENGEVRNLVDKQHYQQIPIKVSGEPALKIEPPDKSESHFSVYFLHKGNSYRIVCGETGPEKPKYGEALEKILSSFTFTDSGEENLPQKGNVKIFLIALDDQGKKGKLVGCGDSVVSVERTVTTTGQIPIKEALSELFSAKEQYVADPGFHNAISNSNLKVDNVIIKNGSALVYLSGNYYLAGACDNPRFKAQIEETILQFPSIKQTSIFINNISLDKILSGQGE